MGLFNEIPFAQYRDQTITGRLQLIAQSNDPAAEANDTLAERLEEISVDWRKLQAVHIGTQIGVYIPVHGQPHLFRYRVSTNADPVPNGRLTELPELMGGGLGIVLSYEANQGQKHILAAVEAARRNIAQHVDFLNTAIRGFNKVLEIEIDKVLLQRKALVNEAAKIAAAINEQMVI